MKIAKNCVVSLSYVLKDDEGILIEESGDQPLVYLHGHRNIVPGLEKALTGMEVGQKASTRISPEDGYGATDPKLKFKLPLEQLDGGDPPPIGSVLQLNNGAGKRFMATLVDMVDDILILDANHPLAGVSLNFDVEIKEIREAKPEEIAHGHVHSPGSGCGHHH